MDTGLSFEFGRASTLVARRLRAAILVGRFGAGFPPELELARQLSISRHHMCEAVHLLDAEVLPTVRSGRNGDISRTQPREEVLARSSVNLLAHRRTPVTDVYQAHIHVASSCAALAAERATEAVLEEMEAVSAGWEAGDTNGSAARDERENRLGV